MLLSAVQAARQAERKVQWANNLKQLGLAMYNYHASLGSLPPLMTEFDDYQCRSTNSCGVSCHDLDLDRLPKLVAHRTRECDVVTDAAK